MDKAFAVSSMSRFLSQSCKTHFKQGIKILGYFKKYPGKGYTVDPRVQILNYPYKKLEPDFGKQYSNFKEDLNDWLPEQKMDELPITVSVDSNHSHDPITGKSIWGIIAFVFQGRITGKIR